jgi:predicted alternative tryptophan synthase beta-subunit
MNNFKLYEIIEINSTGDTAILVESLLRYKKSLYTYFKRYYSQEPILMVTDVFNAAQYALIVPANEMSEAIQVYLQNSNLTNEEKEEQTELIGFQSIMLKELLK